jgi:iron complex transport system substrate-binding protein
VKHKIILNLLFIGLLLGACAPAESASIVVAEVLEPTDEKELVSQATAEVQVQTFTDDLGRTITLSSPPNAIVALGASTLESLFSIGAGAQIAGREEYSTYPEKALEIPSVGSLFGGLPAEAIVGLEPDLIIAPQIISLEQVQALEDLNLQVYWQTNPSNFEDLFANLRELAEITGHEDEAEALILSLEERVSEVEIAISEAVIIPTVFYELDATDPENPYTIGSGVFIDTIVNLAGGINIGGVLDGDYAKISSEEIILQNPDVILLADFAYGVTPEIVAGRAGWENITAVTNGNVFPFDPFLVSVPGPRMVDGLESMANILHPEIFK